VPGQDHGGGTEPDLWTDRCQIGHELQIVGAERIVVEVVLHGPQHVETQVGSQTAEFDLLIPDLPVRYAGPAIAGEDHLQTDVHSTLLPEIQWIISCRLVGGNATRAP